MTETMTVDANLRLLDGSLTKTIQIPRNFYVPPQIVVDGDDYYIRTSSDAIHDPLDFTITRGNGVYIVPHV